MNGPSSKPHSPNQSRHSRVAGGWLWVLILGLVLSPFQSFTKACCCSDRAVQTANETVDATGSTDVRSSAAEKVFCCGGSFLGQNAHDVDSKIDIEQDSGSCCATASFCDCCGGECACGAVQLQLSHRVLTDISPSSAVALPTSWVAYLGLPDRSMTPVVDPLVLSPVSRRHLLFCVWLI